MAISRETARYLLASHIAATSDVPGRNRHISNGDWGLIAVVVVLIVVGFWL